jgi:alkylation response protein AidB-like acyl-CoA dehydrogenase
LTAEEQDFMNNEVNTLCAMINDHDVVTTKDFTRETWDYMRDKGFFGLKIPKEWGGKGFSTQAVSHILAKLGTQSSDANATVAVPNSLGPGELLVRYGTPDQKEYFLPRLADGTLIPCFGLTGPHSGSDATSLIGSDCVVEERNGELGVVASFKKRYITLGPVAGVVGLGLNLADPNGLLKGTGSEGFTVALLERDHPGLRMVKRHFPLNAAFMNGTVEGDNVWIPMSMILGGQEKCGYGWNMFVECLAEGRGVSLPAGSVATGRQAVASVGAYTRVRKQFKVPIAEFGGIQEGRFLYCIYLVLSWLYFVMI